MAQWVKNLTSVPLVTVEVAGSIPSLVQWVKGSSLKKKKKKKKRSSQYGFVVAKPTSIPEDTGLILASLSGLRIHLGYRHSLDPILLWLGIG